ncbi:MAG: hypothetical protein HC797_08200, partial [Anaerolineales bacterium]|nr:hypothetical protein [Anaerolineales bacterium]
YFAELPQGQRIQLTSLGRETYTSAGSLDVTNTFACRSYTETGFSVCFAFLEFFDQYGGVTQFGYPISGFEYHETNLCNILKNKNRMATVEVRRSACGRFRFGTFTFR